MTPPDLTIKMKTRLRDAGILPYWEASHYPLMKSCLKSAFCTDLDFRFETVFGNGREERVRKTTPMVREVLTTARLLAAGREYADVEVLFGTWGMPQFTPEILSKLPALRAVFYAAGSVQKFAAPLLERGITVCSAWQANAVPVSEFTLAHILLACKGYFRNTASLRGPNACRWREIIPDAPGIFGQRVGVIGQGAVGRRVVRLIESFELIPVPVDCYPDLDTAVLESAFSCCHVVTNHLPDKESLRGIYNETLFRMMPPHATFINTGRGAQVDEKALVRVFTERQDLTAIIDVTYPEPPAMDSPLRVLPNIHLSSHISGSINAETQRMADYMIDEFKRWSTGEPLRFEVTPELFTTLA